MNMLPELFFCTFKVSIYLFNLLPIFRVLYLELDNNKVWKESTFSFFAYCRKIPFFFIVFRKYIHFSMRLPAKISIYFKCFPQKYPLSMRLAAKK